jgi:hypothetical protein
MKTRLIMLLAAIFLFVWIGCEPTQKDGNYLTFKVDMSAVKLTDADTVGIRGNVDPLSWTKTYVMDGPDANGIFSVTIPFKDTKYGARVQYKYVINDTVWDNDKYGRNGNRVATVCCHKQNLPVDKWDVLEDFADELLLESSAWDVLASWVYTLSKAKERGLSMDEAALEIVDFWGYPPGPDAKLDEYVLYDEFYQAKTPFGYFEILESTPDRIEFIKNKDWEMMLYLWDTSGVVYDVSAEEMTNMFRKMAEIYADLNGFSMDWQDLDDHQVKITLTR